MATADSSVSDGLSTVAFTTATSNSNGGEHTITPGLVVLCTFLFAVVTVSTLANLFVLLAYKFEKKLRTNFAILVGNLAVTDFIVSGFPMFFFTINILYGYWPLGRVLCGIWVVVDYNCVFASSYMLAAISIDRLWSIKWSIHYRNHNTKKKAGIIVVIVWLLAFAVAMYPVITDRILRTKDYHCHFVPAENPQFVIALAFLGHHIPCIVILICYVIVFIEIRKLFKVRPGDKSAAAKAKARNKVEVATISAAPATVTVNASTGPIPGSSKDCTVNSGDEKTAIADDDTSKKTETAAAANNSYKNTEQKNEPKKDQQPKKQHLPLKRNAAGGQHVAADAKARADRERKSFVTLSYIVIGYVICWVPFHFVYDVSFIRPELISDDLFTATFWLTYVNSTINPFLYAFSSADLRTAVVQMIKCRCLRK